MPANHRGYLNPPRSSTITLSSFILPFPNAFVLIIMSTAVAYFIALAKETGFISPTSKPNNRSSTSTAPASETKHRVHRGTLRSKHRTTRSLNENDLSKTFGTLDLHKVNGNKIGKSKSSNHIGKRKSVWDFSRLSGFFGVAQQEEEEDIEDGEDGEESEESDTKGQARQDAVSVEEETSETMEQSEEDELSVQNEESDDDLESDTMEQLEEDEVSVKNEGIDDDLESDAMEQAEADGMSLEDNGSDNDLEDDTIEPDEEDAESEKNWESEAELESDAVEQDEENEVSEADPDSDSMVDHDSSPPATGDEDNSSIVEDEEEIIPFTRRRIQPMQSEYNDRNLDPNDPRVANWTKDEIWLFNKLARRGTEPLLSSDFTGYFPAFPDILFTNDPNRVFLNSHEVSSYHLVDALNKLINAGCWVRDCLKPWTGPPERPLNLQIKYMHRWSLRDGNFQWKAHIPVVTITAARHPDETIHSVVNRITKKLHGFSRQYRDKWRHPDSHEGDLDERFVHELPTLYGIVIKHSVTAIVTCDTSVPDKPIRTLLTCNWATLGQEVWYALAIAIVMARARNYLMQLDEEGELGPLIVDHGPDPDA